MGHKEIKHSNSFENLRSCRSREVEGDNWRAMQVRRRDLYLRSIVLVSLKKSGHVYTHMEMDQCNYRIYKTEITLLSVSILSRNTIYVLYRIELLSINREKVYLYYKSYMYDDDDNHNNRNHTKY